MNRRRPLVLLLVCGPALAVPRPCDTTADCLAGWVCEFPVGDCAHANGNCEPASTCGSITVPVCGCQDFGSGPNTYLTACDAIAAGDTIASLGACQVGDSCGGQTCAPDSYCRRPPGSCAEFPCTSFALQEQLAETEGSCTPIPASCPPDDDPVCGCYYNAEWSGLKTYANACEAARGLASIAYLGPCAPAGAACGGFFPPCASSSDACVIECGFCGVDLSGTCVPQPAACDDRCVPVCDCGGGWFRNLCQLLEVGSGTFWNPDCGEIRAVRFLSKTEMLWEPRGTATYNTYRATVAPGSPPGPWSCVAPGLTSAQGSESSTPPSGTAWGYLVTWVGGGQEATFGWGGDGCTERVNTDPCPP